MPSGRHRTQVDTRTDTRSDTRLAAKLRQPAYLLRLVAHPRQPPRARSATPTPRRRMAAGEHRHRRVRQLGGGSRGRVPRRLTGHTDRPMLSVATGGLPYRGPADRSIQLALRGSSGQPVRVRPDGRACGDERVCCDHGRPLAGRKRGHGSVALRPTMRTRRRSKAGARSGRPSRRSAS
jgi:hypothetical protein